MIVGHIDCLNEAAREFPSAILAALKTLKDLDFSSLDDGVVQTIHADMKFTLFHAVTEMAADRTPETHVRNIDIHYLLEGEEALGYRSLSTNPVVTESHADADNVFYSNDPEKQSAIKLKPGEFAVCFPWDVHMPLCTTDFPMKVRKVVVKVPVSLLSERC